MFSKPSAHFLVGPGPFERMGLVLVVLGPRGFDVIDQGLTTRPGAAFQVTVAERIVEHFGVCLELGPSQQRYVRRHRIRRDP